MTQHGASPDGAEPAAGAPDDDRLRREAEYHDAAFAADTRQAVGKYYAAAAAAKACYEDRVRQRAAAGAVLEYGCGKGSAAFALARQGARVTGVDISEVGIREAAAEARRLGLEEVLDFRRMNAEALDFEDSSFDLVCGSGILHHLDLDAALAEVNRVLRPGGAAVFFEPLGHNPVINLYRRLTPKMRTEDEHPLRMADVARVRGAFAGAQVHHFGLCTLAAAPLHPAPGSPLLRGLEALDRLVLGLPWMRRFAWIVVLDLRAAS